MTPNWSLMLGNRKTDFSIFLIKKMEFRKSNTPAILVNLLTLLQLVINDSKFVSFYSSFIPWYQSNKISRDFRLTTRWEPNSKRHVFFHSFIALFISNNMTHSKIPNFPLPPIVIFVLYYNPLPDYDLLISGNLKLGNGPRRVETGFFLQEG